MNIYFLLYFIGVLLAIFGGISIFKKYKNPAGFFFLLFGISTGIWASLYYIFLGGNLGYNTTLIVSRLAFAVSLLGMYTFLLFILFFDHRKTPIFTTKVASILIGYVIVFIYSISSNTIIHSLYLGADGVYREHFGVLYFVYFILYILFLPLVYFFIYKQLKKQNYINKLRLKYILYGVTAFIGFGMIFQVILPIFGIWIFEREMVFFLIFFITSIVYTVNRYYFNDLGYGIGKIFVGALSFLSSLGVTYLLYSYIFRETNNGYWGQDDKTGFTMSLCTVLLFVFFYKLFSKLLLGKTQKIELKSDIHRVQEGISYITNFDDLIQFLKKEISNIFKTPYVEVLLIKNEDEYSELSKYFHNDISDRFFINDVVFIEEKKNKFNKEKIKLEIPEDAFLIFPIEGSTKEIIGFFLLGRKAFGDYYSFEEINTIQKFIFFLETHLKYIKAYKQIKDLTVNLDKKVDQQTIEYNHLINKQKEFISMISHEIRSPIGSAVFHADSILDDLKEEKLSGEALKSELEILNSILVKISELTSKLFSVQYYDTHAISLYKENIQLHSLLLQEIEIYSHLHENIIFEHQFDEKINFVSLDKIQFQQVIENIITNAIKFIQNSTGKIFISTKQNQNNTIEISIEDNGKGFEGINQKELFEKYSKGNSQFTGLGMGLYLCKKIIEMHKGTITGETSQKLGGAKIIITIPVD